MRVRKPLTLMLALAIVLAGVLAVSALAQEETVVTEEGYTVFKIGDPRCFVKGPNAGKFGGYVSKRPVDGAPGVVVVHLDAAPYTKPPGRTYVPVRYLANALGVADANISWDGKARRVTLSEPGMPKVQMVIGQAAVTSDGVRRNIDAAPEIAPPGRTMLPARFVAEALGYQVDWDPAERLVLCWKKTKPSFADVKRELHKEMEWRYVAGESKNPVAIPPGYIVLSGNGAYCRDGVQVKEWSDGVVTVFAPVADCLNTNRWPGLTFERMLATCREVLIRTFGSEQFADRLVELASKKRSWLDTIPDKTLTSPDGRFVWVFDDGGDTAINIYPPGRKPGS